jgi:hypothetical protein
MRTALIVLALLALPACKATGALDTKPHPDPIATTTSILAAVEASAGLVGSLAIEFGNAPTCFAAASGRRISHTTGVLWAVAGRRYGAPTGGGVRTRRVRCESP